MSDINIIERNRAETEAFFAERLSRLDVVRTTRTPSGQIIDWVPLESQGEGMGIATPPQMPQPQSRGTFNSEAIGLNAGELDEPGAERGPEGTVPLLRPDIEKMDHRIPLGQRLHKDSTAAFRAHREPESNPWPKGHHYGNSQQTIRCVGGVGALSAYVPQVANSGDFSLIQIGLANFDLGYIQTAEAGWIVNPEVNGDNNAHLFTFFTTNGYSSAGDFIGGWNTQVAGWVQYDPSWYPGMMFTPTSTPDGSQYEITIKYQLWNNNWWFMAQNRWLGYYPSWLYFGAPGDSLFTTLGAGAEQIGFWGEVEDPNANPTTQMGSGYFSAAGWPWSAYMHNLEVQTGYEPYVFQNYNGAISESDPTRYTISPSFNSGTSWGSYAYVGGPG